jgi:spermidine synthase
MAKSVEMVRARLEKKGEKGRYGVVGLGTGSLSCYAKEGERWRIFEIDPVVIGISSNPRNFSFLANCQPNPDIVIGDARLTLAKEPSESFDLIIVDAFSSDAIPIHMLTADAMKMYADKLKPEGVVVLHISNRYLDLDSVLGATIKVLPGVHGFIISDDEADGSYAQSTSTVAVFAKSAEALEPLRSLKEVSEFEQSGLRPWTDDYSDILGPLLSKWRG